MKDVIDLLFSLSPERRKLVELLLKQKKEEKINRLYFEEWFYEVEWKKWDKLKEEEKEKRKWLILCDKVGVGRKLAELLERRGNSCILINKSREKKKKEGKRVVEHSEKFGRDMMASEDLSDHGKNSFGKLKELIEAGDTDYSDYFLANFPDLHIYGMASHAAESIGQHQIADKYRQEYDRQLAILNMQNRRHWISNARIRLQNWHEFEDKKTILFPQFQEG